VLNELNRRITDAQNTIRLLDRFLSQPIGKFRYRISQKKDTAGFGAIWQLLGSGLELTDPLLGAEVERAKQELMDAVNTSDNQDSRALRRLLDYRNYHHYDWKWCPPTSRMRRRFRSAAAGAIFPAAKTRRRFSSRCWLPSAASMIAATAIPRARSSSAW